MTNNKPITAADQLRNLRDALAHCDACGKFVSEQSWSVCPHCGWDIWDDNNSREEPRR